MKQKLAWFNVIGQEFQRKRNCFAGYTPLRTTVFRRTTSSHKAKCVQIAGFTNLYFTKPEFSAFFLLCQHVSARKNLKIFF